MFSEWVVVCFFDPNHDQKHHNYFDNSKQLESYLLDLDKYQIDTGCEYCVYIPFNFVSYQIDKLRKYLLFKVEENDPKLKERLEFYNKGVNMALDCLKSIVFRYSSGQVFE